MADKILRLAPGRGFFFAKGIHLAFPEKMQVRLPDNYVANDEVLQGIRTGAILDVNKNIAEAPKAQEKKAEAKKEEVKEETKVEAPAEEAPAEVVEEPKGRATKKK